VSDGEHVPEEEWPTVPGAAVVLDKGYEWVPNEAPEDQDDEAAVSTEDEDQDDDEEEDGQSVEGIEQTWICLDPEAAGLCPVYEHSRRRPRASTEREDLDPAEPAAAAEAAAEAKRTERRRVIANNEAWRSAEKVRREWLAGFVSRKTAPQ